MKSTAKFDQSKFLFMKITGKFDSHNWNGPQSHLGPWLFWFPRNVVLEKFGPQEIWTSRNWSPKRFGPYIKMPYNNFHGESKLLGDQICQRPKFLGTKKVRGPNEIGDHFSYSQFDGWIRCSKLFGKDMNGPQINGN